MAATQLTSKSRIGVLVSCNLFASILFLTEAKAQQFTPDCTGPDANTISLISRLANITQIPTDAVKIDWPTEWSVDEQAFGKSITVNDTNSFFVMCDYHVHRQITSIESTANLWVINDIPLNLFYDNQGVQLAAAHSSGGNVFGINLSRIVSGLEVISWGTSQSAGNAFGYNGPGTDVPRDTSSSLLPGFIRNPFSSSDGMRILSIGGNPNEALSVKDSAYRVGGNGANGTNAGKVTAYNSGAIYTSGFNTSGISAMSIGGNGGSGNSVQTNNTFSSISIGGNGGNGGIGGDVLVINGFNGVGGTITTTNQNAIGIKAQSIGGGGGEGGAAQAQDTSIFGGFALAIGGNGGTGGHAGSVTVNHQAGSITTDGQFANDLYGAHAVAILAQSIGGGGGNGGHAVVMGDTNIFPSVHIDVSKGGSGGAGGAGGAVTVTTSSGTAINTVGRHSGGIVAQSIGGGGGNGGTSVDADNGTSAASLNVSVGMGGHGTGGGSSADVLVNANGDIQTSGDKSAGIIAQSISGSGGNGGNVVSSISSTSLLTANISANFGGSAGDGAKAGSAAANLAGSITTFGDHSAGMFAQSIGGGGGNGGSVHVYSNALGGAGPVTLNGTVNLGGTAGSGGDADAATSAISGKIETYGVHSHGVHLQSVGGGGGNGGHIHTLQQTGNLNPYSRAISATVNVGGTGGDGGDGGEGLAVFSGDIITHQVRSSGLVVQSIGGGGGSGGAAQSVTATSGVPENPTMALARFEQPDLLAGTEPKDSLSVTANVGGKGGSGGLGGNVYVRLNGGSINTLESQSHAVLAQSIGGGGGMGGNVNATGFAGINTYSFDLALGGSGGKGNKGGDIEINFVSGSERTKISTESDHSFGILAQSIGGGGGEGGSAHTDLGKLPALSNSAVALTLGGSGGSSGTGGSITISDVDITTAGVQAHGVMAQSIGGGGGNATISDSSGSTALNLGGGGGDGNHGGTLSLTDILVVTKGDLAAGVVAQSIGGGGGAAGIAGTNGLLNEVAQSTVSSLFNLTSSGSAGDGGTVNINHGVNATTSGTTAAGVIAQSIGNGGSATFISNGDAPINYTHKFAGSSNSGLITFSDAAGGTYVVNTSGHGAVGIIAQSIAGSGGALFSDGSLSNINVNPNFDVGGGSSGGLNFTLDSSKVSTSGDYAPGLYLQSGNSIYTVFASDGQATYQGTQGGFDTLEVGDLQVKNRLFLGSGSSITTSGRESDGIVFQTNSYFGSTADQSQTDNDRSMSIWIEGTVSVSGKDSWAVNASNKWILSGSLPMPEEDNITTSFTLGADGAILASGEAAGGIYISDVGNMMININGSINVGSLTALQIGEPTTNAITITINNDVTGDIRTDGYTPGTNYALLENSKAAKLINNGHRVSGNVLGNFDYSITNQGSHTLTVDAASNSANLIDVQSFSLEKFSYVDLALTSLPTPAFTSIELIKAQTLNLPDNFDPFNRNPIIKILNYQTSVNDGSVVLTDIKIDINQPDFLRLTAAQQVAPLAQQHIDAIRDGSLSLQQSSTLYQSLLRAVNAGATLGGSFEAAMDYLAGLIADPDTQSASNAASNASDKIHSCGIASSLNPIEQGECVWSSLTQTDTELGNASHEESSVNLALGAQFEFGEKSFWGYGFGYDSVDIDRSSSDADGDRFHLAGIYKYIDGNWFYSTSLVGSYSRIKAIRSFADDFNEGALVNAYSEREAYLLTGRVRSGYRVETNYVDIIPMVDVDVFLAHQLNFAEEDAAGVGMLVDDSTNLLFDLHPRLQFGKDLDFIGGTRLFATLGARFALNDPSVNVGFVDGLADSATTEVTQEREDMLLSYGLGLTTDLNEQFELRASYDVVEGSDEKNERLSVRLGYRF